jgi:hypothetical protein
MLDRHRSDSPTRLKLHRLYSAGQNCVELLAELTTANLDTHQFLLEVEIIFSQRQNEWSVSFLCLFQSYSKFLFLFIQT